MTTNTEEQDPFPTAMSVFTAMVSGVGWLEMRRQTKQAGERDRNAFRAAWFTSRRAVIGFRGLLDEFETFVAEDEFGARSFRLGAVRLVLDGGRARDLWRLRDRAWEVGRELGTSLDALSEHLGPEYAPLVAEAHRAFESIGAMPEEFTGLVRQGRAAVEAYSALLDALAGEEGFVVEVASIDTARSRRGRGPRRS